mgnify:CR=1 FL=1
MSEPFDPSILETSPDGLPSSAPAPSRLSEALEATSTTYHGLEGLPVDEPPLDETDDTGAAPDPDPSGEAAPFSSPATPPTAPVSPDFQALQQELALLRSELQASRVASMPTPALPAAPDPSLTLDSIQEREAAIWAAAFQDIEGLDGVGTTEYEQARAARYARAGGEVRQLETAYQRQETQREIAIRLAAQEDLRLQQQAGTEVVRYAVETARAAGYDVHPPGSPAHEASRESVQFWAVGQARSQAGRDVQAEVAETLRFMPPKVPATDAPRPPRPQPMARQGAGVPGVAAGPAATNEPYVPRKLNDILREQQQMQRIGVA